MAKNKRLFYLEPVTCEDRAEDEDWFLQCDIILWETGEAIGSLTETEKGLQIKWRRENRGDWHPGCLFDAIRVITAYIEAGEHNE